MASTTDTLIFELKVKDDATKVFDSWEKRLKNLEKQYQTFINSQKEHVKQAQKVADAAKTVEKATSKLFPTFQKIAAAGKKAWTMATDIRVFGDEVKKGTKALLQMKVTFEMVGKAVSAMMGPFGIIIDILKGLGGILLAPFKMALNAVSSFAKFTIDAFKDISNTVIDFAIDATKNFLKFEQALLVVSRTASKSFKEGWAGVKDFGRAIIDMSLSMGKFAKGGDMEELGLQGGIAANKLAEVAGIAGQLGIEGKESILEFVNVVGKMAVATNFTASGAAELLAILRNIFSLNDSDLERLASVINELGNTTVATQTQIGEMMRRMGGTASFLGLASHQVAAFAATMREAGVTVRVGGTAMSQFMIRVLQDGKEMAESLGLSWTSLKTTLESNNPVPALQQILQKINQIRLSGGKITVAEKLREMGFNGVRLQDTLLKLSASTGKLTKNLNAAKIEWTENNSLVNEFNKTLETAGHQFNEFWLAVDAVKKIIGEDLAVAFGTFTEEFLTPLVKKVLEFVKSQPMQDFFQKTLPEALKVIGEHIAIVAEEFEKFMENANNIGIWAATTEAIGALWGKLKDLIKKEWELLNTSSEGQATWLEQRFSSAWDVIKADVKLAWGVIQDDVINALKTIGDVIEKHFGQETREMFEDFVEFIGAVPGIVLAVTNEVKNLLPGVREIVKAMTSVSKLYKDIKEGLKEFKFSPLEAFKASYTGDVLDFGLGTLTKKQVDEFNKVGGAARTAAKGISTITRKVNEATQATEQHGKIATGQSVWPDSSFWIQKNATDLQKMNYEIQQSIQGLLGIDRAAPRALSAIGIVSQANTPSQQAQYRGGVMVDTPSKPITKTVTKAAAPTTTVNFVGTNVIDESSKNRFVRSITNTQTHINASRVRI